MVRGVCSSLGLQSPCTPVCRGHLGGRSVVHWGPRLPGSRMLLACGPHGICNQGLEIRNACYIGYKSDRWGDGSAKEPWPRLVEAVPEGSRGLRGGTSRTGPTGSRSRSTSITCLHPIVGMSAVLAGLVNLVCDKIGVQETNRKLQVPLRPQVTRVAGQ